MLVGGGVDGTYSILALRPMTPPLCRGEVPGWTSVDEAVLGSSPSQAVCRVLVLEGIASAKNPTAKH